MSGAGAVSVGIGIVGRSSDGLAASRLTWRFFFRGIVLAGPFLYVHDVRIVCAPPFCPLDVTVALLVLSTGLLLTVTGGFSFIAARLC